MCCNIIALPLNLLTGPQDNSGITFRNPGFPQLPPKRTWSVAHDYGNRNSLEMQSFYESINIRNSGYGDELENTAVYSVPEGKRKSFPCPPLTNTSGYGVLERTPSHGILESKYGSLPVSEDLYAKPKEAVNSMSPPPKSRK